MQERKMSEDPSTDRSADRSAEGSKTRSSKKMAVSFQVDEGGSSADSRRMTASANRHDADATLELDGPLIIHPDHTDNGDHPLRRNDGEQSNDGRSEEYQRHVKRSGIEASGIHLWDNIADILRTRNPPFMFFDDPQVEAVYQESTLRRKSSMLLGAIFVTGLAYIVIDLMLYTDEDVWLFIGQLVAGASFWVIAAALYFVVIRNVLDLDPARRSKYHERILYFVAPGMAWISFATPTQMRICHERDNLRGCLESVWPHPLVMMPCVMCARLRLTSIPILWTIPFAFLFGRLVEDPSPRVNNVQLAAQFITAAVCSFLAFQLDSYSRASFTEQVTQLRQRYRAEALRQHLDTALRNLVPESAVFRLSNQEPVIDVSAAATIIAMQVYDFTLWSTQVLPNTVAQTLNAIIVSFDAAVNRAGAERIKAFGDRYFCGYGVFHASMQPAVDAIHALQLALEFHELIGLLNKQLEAKIYLQVGCDSGFSVGAIVGSRSLNYEVLGPTMQTAMLVSNHAPKGGTLATEVSLNLCARQRRLVVNHATEGGEAGDVGPNGPPTKYFLVTSVKPMTSAQQRESLPSSNETSVDNGSELNVLSETSSVAFSADQSPDVIRSPRAIDVGIQRQRARSVTSVSRYDLLRNMVLRNRRKNVAKHRRTVFDSSAVFLQNLQEESGSDAALSGGQQVFMPERKASLSVTSASDPQPINNSITAGTSGTTTTTATADFAEKSTAGQSLGQSLFGAALATHVAARVQSSLEPVRVKKHSTASTVSSNASKDEEAPLSCRERIARRFDIRFSDPELEKSFQQFAVQQSLCLMKNLTALGLLTIGMALLSTLIAEETTKRQEITLPSGILAILLVVFTFVRMALLRVPAMNSKIFQLKRKSKSNSSEADIRDATHVFAKALDLLLAALVAWSCFLIGAFAKESILNGDYEYIHACACPILGLSILGINHFWAPLFFLIATYVPMLIVSYVTLGFVFTSTYVTSTLMVVAAWYLAYSIEVNQRSHFASLTVSYASLQAVEDELSLARGLLGMVVPPEIVRIVVGEDEQRARQENYGLFLLPLPECIIGVIRLDGIGNLLAESTQPQAMLATLEGTVGAYEAVLRETNTLRHVQLLGDTVMFVGGLQQVNSRRDDGPIDDSNSGGLNAAKLLAEVTSDTDVNPAMVSDGDGKEGFHHALDDQMLSAAHDACLAILKVQYSLQPVIGISGVLVAGSAYACLVGDAHSSFDVMGEAVRRANGLLHAAPAGFVGVQASVQRVLQDSRHPDATTIFGEPVQWRVRGVGATTMVPLQSGPIVFV